MYWCGWRYERKWNLVGGQLQVSDGQLCLNTPLFLQISYHISDTIDLLIGDILTTNRNINLMFLIMIKLCGHKNPGTAPTWGARFLSLLIKTKLIILHTLFSIHI